MTTARELLIHAGCQPVQDDPACMPPAYDGDSDPISLRCFDQKRRFGIDFLHPISRYVDGFSKTSIEDRSGTSVPNPLFAGGRDPSLVSLATIVGVPWQDIARDHQDLQSLEYLSAAELRTLDRWSVILGDPENGIPPTDPFMLEGPDPRSGINPITGDTIVPPSATTLESPINGHEYLNEGAERDDLQYACIFELPESLDCTSPTLAGCDCQATQVLKNKPVCNGTEQTHGKAYPGLRQLELAQKLGRQSAVASVCPRNTSDPAREDFGYLPAVRAIMARVSRTLR